MTAKKKTKTKKKSKLTDQQKKFVQEKHLGANGSEAARKAGYSEKTARQQAHRLLTNDDILHELRILKEKSQEKFDLTEQMLVNELMNIAFFDVTTLMTVDEYSGRIKMRDDLTKLPAHIRRGMKKVSQTSNALSQSVNFEGHDKMAAIDKLAQHMGFLKGPNVSNGGGNPDDSESGLDRIRRIVRERAERLRKKRADNSEGGE